GMPQIWQLTHAFRDGERGATHHPEFSMLEWYRTGVDYTALMDDCEALLRRAQAAAALLGTERIRAPGPAPYPAADAGSSLPPRPRGEGPARTKVAECLPTMLVWRGRTADADQQFERLSVAEAFARHTGIDILATAPDP